MAKQTHLEISGVYAKMIIKLAQKAKMIYSGTNKEFYVVCDNIRSLENIGSIFRTSDALGVSKIYLCGISGKPPRWGFPARTGVSAVADNSRVPAQGNLATLHHKISKTALGAENTIPFEYFKQVGRLIDKLKKDKIKVVALEQSKKAVSYDKFKLEFPMALILGNEVKGISKKILQKSDEVIFLPMAGKKESLNVSVAFGVAGYEINKYRKIINK